MLLPIAFGESVRASELAQPVEFGRTPPTVHLLRGEPVVLTGQALDHVAMPVGGICAGQVYLRGDGRLGGWRVDGRTSIPSPAVDPLQALVLATIGPDGRRTRSVIASEKHGGSFRGVEFLGAFPIAEVRYSQAVGDDPGLNVSLVAGGPFVPLNPEDSSLPCVVLRVTLHNPTADPIRAALGCCLQNPVAMEVAEAAGVTITNRVHREAGMSAVVMGLGEGSEALDPAMVGTMALCCVSDGNAWPDVDPATFDPLAVAGEAVAYSGQRRATAGVSAPLEIGPGEARDVVVAITWHFPTHEHGHGAMYATRFGDALEVARYLAANKDRLLGETDRFVRTFYVESSLPWWILQRVMAPTSTLATRTCEWWANGLFHGRDFAGGPGGNSFDAWGPSQAEARFFPTLARSVRLMQDFGAAMDPETGAIATRGGGAPGEGATIESQATAFVKLIREHVSDTSDVTLRARWPDIRKAAMWLVSQDAADSPGGEPDGIVSSSWPTRFGRSLAGTDAHLSGLYHAGLLASLRCANLVGDGESARKLMDAYLLGRVWMERQAHADGFFSHRAADGERTEHSDVCFAPHILGPAMARHVDLTQVWLDSMVRDSLSTIARSNWTMGDIRVAQDDSVTPGLNAGLRLHARPKDQVAPAPLGENDPRDIALEYEVAAAMIAFGDERHDLIHTGLSMLRALDVRAHAPGRNPFDESDVGEHAPGLMAAWGVYHALTGFVHDASLAGTIGNLGRVQEDDFRAFFVGSTAWGLYHQRRTANSHISRWEFRWGSQRLIEIQARPPRGMGRERPFDMALRTRDRRIAGSMIQDETRTVITFVSPITVEAGDFIEVAWTW